MASKQNTHNTELLKREGKIRDHDFEAIALALARDCRHTPDVLVIAANWTVELHETKGIGRDDVRVKAKVAAAKFPLRLVGVQEVPRSLSGGWKIEELWSYARGGLN